MEIKDILDEARGSLFSENMVKELSDIGITEYQRGIIKGRIDMMNWIENRLDYNEEDEDEASSL